jgi:hypothetical protein
MILDFEMIFMFVIPVITLFVFGFINYRYNKKVAERLMELYIYGDEDYKLQEDNNSKRKAVGY